MRRRVELLLKVGPGTSSKLEFSAELRVWEGVTIAVEFVAVERNRHRCEYLWGCRYPKSDANLHRLNWPTLSSAAVVERALGTVLDSFSSSFEQCGSRPVALRPLLFGPN